MPRQTAPERGTFRATREGYGFVTPSCGGADLFVPAADTTGALEGDEVLFELVRFGHGSLRDQGRVLEIVARGVRHFTGVVAGTRKVRVKRTAQTVREMLAANIGAKVFILNAQRCLIGLDGRQAFWNHLPMPSAPMCWRALRSTPMIRRSMCWLREPVKPRPDGCGCT